MRRQSTDAKCWTVAAIARYLDVADKTVRAWIHAGKIAHVRLPNREIRVKPEHLQLFLTERTRPSKGEGRSVACPR